MNWPYSYRRLLTWREKHISEKYLILILSLLVGVFCSIASYLLKMLIHFFQQVVQSHYLAGGHSWWLLICPAVGILLSALFVKYVVRDDISHGITKILYAISQRKSIIKKHNIWSSVVGSAITIGFGGSVGAEAPIVLTGSAIGSNLAKFFRLDQKTMMLMIACGAAGAIGGIFKAPIAGLVFTLEVLMIDMTMSNISPLLISSITATALTYLFSGDVPMFALTRVESFSVARIPWYLVLGVLCGLVSLYFTRGMNFLESQFKRISSLPMKVAIGGLSLGVLIFLFPSFYGEGYDAITMLIDGKMQIIIEDARFGFLQSSIWWMIAYFVLIILFKIVASVATNGGGGVGGIFAPSLFVGAFTGIVTALLLSQAGVSVPAANFVLAGMAGLMSGVMHAPLTGIFLIAELSGGYHLFMPLMIVSVVSYLVILFFEPHSLYAMRLAQKGELLTHNKDRAVLTLMHLHEVTNTSLTQLNPNMTLGELVKVIAASSSDIFPVVGKRGRFEGILLVDEVRNIMFQPRLYDRFTVSQLMISPIAYLYKDMSMERVMEVFEDTGVSSLVVIDDQHRYVGMVFKSDIFRSYRKTLVNFSEE